MGNNVGRALSNEQIQRRAQALLGGKCQNCRKGSPSVRMATPTAKPTRRFTGPVADLVCRIRPQGFIGQWLGCKVPTHKIPPGGGQVIPGLQDAGGGTNVVLVTTDVSFDDVRCNGTAGDINCQDLVCNLQWQVTQDGQVTLGVYDQNGKPLQGYYVYASQTSDGILVTPDPSDAINDTGEAVTDSNGLIVFNISVSVLANIGANGYPASDYGLTPCACGSGSTPGTVSTQNYRYWAGTVVFTLAGVAGQSVGYKIGVLEQVTCTVGYAACDGNQCESCPCTATGCSCAAPSNA